ncbi:putative Golgi-associated plant pathogenesis-related protein 1 [Hypsibius exemplaris]|uniref:Golgi-associated plant pathogenesis-related protein 1 n=1 Tax=Hypsibius exemplaris TaxID=2072580 RepID=A0A1W0WB69_HYPEX|nr:putative Golgi-associated plant pathogenesis-related protein 1 [Hypsibius exemplaris]
MLRIIALSTLVVFANAAGIINFDGIKAELASPGSPNQYGPPGSSLNMPGAASSRFGAFETEALRAHNTYRAMHGAAPLRLNQELCNVAQNWANYLAQRGSMVHSQTQHGENLYWTSANSVPSGATAVDAWYSEVEDYFSWFGTGPTGHFTQVVWKGTREMGIAQSRGRNGVYVVANYSPPGNMQGEYDENVGPIQRISSF